MKMKLKEAQVRLQNLAKLGTKTFPAKLSFAISCNIEKLQKEAEHIEKERKKLCEQYADKDDDGKPVMVDSVINGVESKEYKMDASARAAFGEEYDSLLDTEVDVNIRMVKTGVVEQCERAERYDIPTVAELLALAFMLEEE